MSAPVFTRIRAGRINYRRLFTCLQCGATHEGETESADLEVESLEGLIAELTASAARGHGFPVGWSRSGPVFYCGPCTRGESR